MSLKFKCPACGDRDVVPDEMAGERVNCKQCGAKIRLPARTATGVATPPTQTQGFGTTLAPVATDGAADAYACAICRQSFAVEDVYDQRGTIICKGCFAAQQAQSQEADAPSASEEPISCAECGAAVPPDQIEEWEGRLMCATCATLAAARPKMPGGAGPKKPIAHKRASKLPWIVGGSAAVALLGLVLFMRSGKESGQVADSQSPAPKPAQVHAVPAFPTPSAGPTADEVMPQLVQLRGQGLDQENAGDWKGAANTYGKMIQLGEQATNPSEAVRAELATARQSLSGANDRLAAAAQAVAATAPAPQPTAPVVVAAPATQPLVNQNWEQQHAAQIRQLLREGETRLASNDVFKATLVYQRLFALVGLHLPEIQDLDLKRQITSAATTRGKLLIQVRSSPENVSLTADTLLASGLEALQESHWQAGLESLSDVRALFDRNVRMPVRAADPKYLMALHGMAVAYLKLKEAPKAGELFEDNSPLGAAVDRTPNREMVINRAALDIIQRTKAMRAAKSLTAWLQKHPGDKPDEDLLNILGTALFIAEQHTTGKSKLEQFAMVYQKENARLEDTRPGEKRWGVEWLAAREAQRKLDERTKALNEYAQLSRQAASAYQEWQTLTGYYNTFNANGVRKASLARVQAAEQTFNGYNNSAREARKNIPDMTWLTQIEPVLPPVPQGMTAVAIAAPAEAGGSDSGPSVFSIPNVTLHDAPPPPPSSGSQTPTESGSPPKPVHVSVPRYALAFAIDKTRLISSADVVGQVTQVRMVDSQGQPFSAHVTARQDQLVLLELDAGQGGFYGYLNLAESFPGGPVQCACVPQESVFGPQPVMLSGQAVASPREGQWAVSLADHPRLAGSPLLDAQGQVVGVVVAKRDDLRTHLPTVSLAQLREFLTAQSALPAAPSGRPDPMNVLEVVVQEN